MHAPVGLSIGSKTTMEIAVSVMAQLTQLRRESKDLAHSPQPAELGTR
ncbi:MAG: XdhC family protein [Luminiphilus sp.]